jgi:hypothetical protein
MFRKLGLILGVAIAISAAALIPTAASAKSGNGHGNGHWHGHGNGHWHGRGLGVAIYAPTYVADSDCYTVKRVIDTPFGPRVRRVTVCG